jgi:hypothetical protein
MQPVIWAAVIAGGVSVIGNVATLFVARFGRDVQREQFTTAASVELAKLRLELERTQDERRESARQERRELYTRVLTAANRIDDFGEPRFLPTEQEFNDANRDFERMYAEVLVAGTASVQEAVGAVVDALHAVGAEMRRFEGGQPERFLAVAAYREVIDGAPRGRAVTAARADLIHSMRDDVTLPYLPEPPDRLGD